MSTSLALPAPLVGRRLLVVGVNWPAETFIARKLSGLARAGLSITVAATNPGPSHARTEEGIEVLRLPLPLGEHWPGMRATLAEFTAIARRDAGVARASGKMPSEGFAADLLRSRRFAALGHQRPDLVHFEWNAAAVDYLPMIDVWGCPFVVSCRGAQVSVRPHVPGNEGYVRSLREVFAQAAAVHCVSEAIRNEAIALGLAPEKAVTITPAVPPDDFLPSRTRVSKAPFRVISIGALSWRKANELGLRAFRRLIDAGVDARYTIVGDGEDRIRVLYTIQDLGLSDQVEWTGTRSPDEVRARLQQADVFLLTSYSEGIANVALEAMSCGLPIVTSDCGGMREAVRDGVDGVVVPVRDLDATTQALLALARAPDLRRAMGASARQRIVDHFTLDGQVRQFLELYASILARGTL